MAINPSYQGIAVATSFQTKVPASSRQIEKAGVIFLGACGVTAASLSIVFIGPAAMRRLNRSHLGHDYTTDIVTFDLSDKPGRAMEGELYICPQQAARNAREHGQPLERELLRYLAHGILHLCGHDDATPAQRSRMSQLEDRLLDLWP